MHYIALFFYSSYSLSRNEGDTDGRLTEFSGALTSGAPPCWRESRRVGQADRDVCFRHQQDGTGTHAAHGTTPAAVGRGLRRECRLPLRLAGHGSRPQPHASGRAKPHRWRRREDTRMSQLSVPVILRNAREYVLARHGHLAADQVHTYESQHALIDTGALHVVLPPHVAEQLGLLLMGSTGATMADGRLVEGEMSEPVTIELFQRQ